MSDKVRILLVGIGGYAFTYLNPLLDEEHDDCEIVGCVDPFPASCPRLDDIKARKIPLFDSMEAFFAAGLSADLAVITTPIHLHVRQMKLALRHGCHVLCEKPLCGDVNDLPSLIEARDATGKTVSIGYQWSHSEAILSLKKDIMAGLYGAPVLLKTLVLWPRDRSYYARGSGWAGKLRAKDGSLILDSVANNATAHYLHNIFYVLGETIDSSAMPVKLEASLWRANEIENYDTCAMNMTFANGARGLYLVSHATEKVQDPVFEYTFEKGRVTYSEGNGEKQIHGILADGTEKCYGDPFAGATNKLWRAVAAVKNASIRPVCGIEAAMAHSKCISEAQKSGVNDFPSELICGNAAGTGVVVSGLYESLQKAYEDGAMWRGL